MHGVTFEENELGECTGKWTTPDDALHDDIMDEDMGIELQMEGLGMLDENKPIQFDTDNLSVGTLGSVMGRPALPPPPQAPTQPASQMQESTASVPGSLTGSDAGSPTGSNPSTEDSPAVSGGDGA